VDSKYIMDKNLPFARRTQLLRTEVPYSMDASFEHKQCRIIATQKVFISFAGEDLFKRSEKDLVLEYVIHLSTYEVMI
jgi:hypothetical protein